MADVFTIKRGDTATSLRYALLPATVDLTGANVVFVWHKKGDNARSSRNALIITATGTPTVQHDWQTGDTATIGEYEGEFEVTYENGKKETFPNKGFIAIQIGQDI